MAGVSSLIVTKKPLSTGAWATYDYDETLAARFRLCDKFDNPYMLYRMQHGKLLLPRAVCPLGPIDYRITGFDVDYDLLMGPRHDEQDRVICEAYDLLQAGQSFVIQAPTGFGKTYLGLALAALMRRKMLVVVTKDDLFDQWVEAAHKFLGIPKQNVGRIRQDTCKIGSQITIGMIHSLAKEGKYPDHIKKEFPIVLYDEVHRVAAEEFMKVAGMFASMWRIGLSATTDRADGKQVVFHAHIGPVRVKSDQIPMTPEVYRYRTTYELPLVPRKNPKTGKVQIVKLPHNPGKVGHVISHMVKDEPRNRLLAKLMLMAHKNGRRIVAFSDQLEHLEDMSCRMLAHGVPAKDMGLYVGGISKQQKTEGLKKKLLLATYGFCSEGTDLVDFDCAVFLTPRSDVRQSAGRVMRFAEGKQTPIVIETIDDDSNVFSGYAAKRKTFYQSIGAKVVDVS